MVFTSNLVEILISRVLRPHGLVVTVHWISVISWPLIDHVLYACFRTNLMKIYIRGSTDLINSWSYFIEFPSYPGLWLAKHFPCILDKLVGIVIRGSSDLIKILSYFVESPSIFLIFLALAAHFWTNCTWDWPQILWKYLFELSIYLTNFASLHFSASWTLINLTLSVHFWANCSTATCIHRCLVCIR